MVVFQVQVFQVAYVRQLVDSVLESFTVRIAAQTASFLTHLVPMWQMDLARLEVLFFFVTVQELCVLRQIRPVLVCELETLIFAPIRQKLHVSSGERIAHAILAGTQDSSNPTQNVPLWSIQLEKSTSQKLDM